MGRLVLSEADCLSPFCNKFNRLTCILGTGKTTIVKRLTNELLKTNNRISGFYTEEIRNAQGNRIGFDVVSLDAINRGILARNE